MKSISFEISTKFNSYYNRIWGFYYAFFIYSRLLEYLLPISLWLWKFLCSRYQNQRSQYLSSNAWFPLQSVKQLSNFGFLLQSETVMRLVQWFPLARFLLTHHKLHGRHFNPQNHFPPKMDRSFYHIFININIHFPYCKRSGQWGT